MNEESHLKKKVLSSLSAESGNAIAAPENEQRLKRETLESVRNDLSSFAEENDVSYKIEKGNGVLAFREVGQEYFSLLLTHMKPLLKEANELLEDQQSSFRMRFRIEGSGFSIVLEPFDEQGERGTFYD